MTTGQIIFVLIATLFVALVKTISGMGYPLLLIPVLALFLELEETLVIVASSNLAMNIVLIRSTRHAYDKSVPLARFLATGIVGAVIGTTLLTRLDQQLLRWALVFLILVFVASRLRPLTGEETAPGASRIKRVAMPAGLVAGFFQGSAGISGPVVSPFLLWSGLRKESYVFAMSFVFAVQGSSQIVVLAADGAFTRSRLLLGLALVVVAQAVVPLGGRLRSRLDANRFEQFVLILLVGAAISLALRNL